jgi:hypothetical protein
MHFRVKKFGIFLIFTALAVSSCGGAPPKKAVNKLSNTEICSQATMSGKWETRSKYQAYVKIAKSRGLSCGVKSETNSCPSNLNACSEDVICTGARSRPYFGSKRAPFWSTHPVFKSYAAEARSRGLSCRGKY